MIFNKTKMNIVYFKRTCKNNHVSYDAIKEFEDSLINIDIKKSASSFVEKCTAAISYKFPQIKFCFHRKKKTFSILMGSCDFYSFILEYKTYKYNAIYLFDAWPYSHNEIIYFCNILNIQYIFCSSYDATQILKDKLPKKTSIIWIPEAIRADEYLYFNPQEKSIDVVQFGRKYDAIQDKLCSELKKNSINYLYEKDKGHLLFETRQSFIEGLAKSKISICFPRSITHPEVAKGQETMTIRYLQSMASKTLVVGRIPQEMKKLFSYNPVIELNLESPGEHIKDILTNYNDYIPLIENNYNEVITNHQWSNRWELISNIINNI